MAWKIDGKIGLLASNYEGNPQQDTYRIAYKDASGNDYEIEKVYFLSADDIAYFETLTQQEQLAELATGKYNVWHRYWDPMYYFAHCYTYQSNSLPSFLFSPEKSGELKSFTVYTKSACNAKSHLILARYDGDDIATLDYSKFYVIANNNDFTIRSSTLCDFKTQYNEDVYETVIEYTGSSPMLLSKSTHYMFVARMRHDNDNNYDLVYDADLSATEPVARSLQYDNYNIHDNKNQYWRDAVNATVENGFVKFGISADDLQWANENEPFSACYVEWDQYDDSTKTLSWHTLCNYPVGSNNPIDVSDDVEWYRLNNVNPRISATSIKTSAYTAFADDGMRFASILACNEHKSPTARGGFRYPYNEPDDQTYSSCIDTYQYYRISGEQYACLLYTPTTDCRLVSFSFFNNSTCAYNVDNRAIIELNDAKTQGTAYGALTEDHRIEYKKSRVITMTGTTEVSSQVEMIYKHYMVPSQTINLSAGKTYAFALYNDFNDSKHGIAYFRKNASADERHYNIIRSNPYYLGGWTATDYNAYAIITTAAVEDAQA